MAVHHVKQNDTAPPAEATLTVAGSAVSIQSATVKFIMVDSSGAVKVSATANNDQNTDGSDGSKGKVSYDWTADDTDQAGTYLAEWEVTFADGTVRTFPTAGWDTVVVHSDLG